MDKVFYRYQSARTDYVIGHHWCLIIVGCP